MSDLLLRISQALTGLIILMYGVGYLVASLFYGSWGINASGLELIRAHYIHIGFLCLTPPFVLGGIHYSGKIISANQLSKRDGTPIPWTRPGKYAFIALPTGLYLVALFADRSQIHSDVFVYAPMVALPITVIVFLTFINRLISSHSRRANAGSTSLILELPSAAPPVSKKPLIIRFEKAMKRIICGFAWILVVCICIGIRGTIKDLLIHQWTVLTLYVTLALLVAVLTEINISNIILVTRQEMRPLLALGWLCVFIPLGYFMVIAFAFSIFPYVPASRGGANYVEAMPIKVEFLTDKPGEALQPLLSSPVLGTFIIEDIGDLIYIGKESVESIASEWRHRKKRPTVIILNKKELRSIRFIGA